MSKRIIQLNEGAIKDELKELVRGSAEETLNDLLEKAALTGLGPQVIRKGQNNVSEIQEKVLSMYAKGLSDRDISAILKHIYGFDVSHGTVSRIVERIQPRFAAWQSRALESVYAFVYVDAMIVKVKSEGKAQNKAVSARVFRRSHKKGCSPKPRWA